MKKKRAKRQTAKLNIDVLEVRQISLVDEFGTCRASLSCSGGDGGIGGITSIEINDDSGRPRIEFEVARDGSPFVRLNAPSQNPGVALAAHNGQGNGLSVYDHEGKPLIKICISDPDSDDPRGATPEIVVLDPHSRRAWSSNNGSYTIPSQQEADEQARRSSEE